MSVYCVYCVLRVCAWHTRALQCGAVKSEGQSPGQLQVELMARCRVRVSASVRDGVCLQPRSWLGFRLRNRVRVTARIRLGCRVRVQENG